jgi:cytoskeletal protein CcmA (bactofilin family)
MSKIDFQNVHTMIGTDAVIEGEVELKGGLIIYGTIKGNITTNGPVRIARSATIVGDIRASDIHIGGSVQGNVFVKNRAVLGGESKLHGDLVYLRLLIEDGAEFRGNCVLIDDPTIVTESSGVNTE